MHEGVNQGCPLSFTLAVLVLSVILLQLTAKLNTRAQQRLQLGNLGDGSKRGETHPLAYIDDCGATVYVEGVLFFLEDFPCLGKSTGCHINSDKTHITTSTNVTSSITSIAKMHGKVFANSVGVTLAIFSISTFIDNGKPVSTHVDITTCLGQPFVSTSFAHSFFMDRLQANMEDSTKLANSVLGPHTALCLFA